MAITITLSDDEVRTILENIHRDLALAIVRDAIRKAQGTGGISTRDPAAGPNHNDYRPCTCGTTAGCFLHPRSSAFSTTSGPIRDKHYRGPDRDVLDWD
jgi:hypothetical protein